MKTLALSDPIQIFSTTAAPEGSGLAQGGEAGSALAEHYAFAQVLAGSAPPEQSGAAPSHPDDTLVDADQPIGMVAVDPSLGALAASGTMVAPSAFELLWQAVPETTPGHQPESLTDMKASGKTTPAPAALPFATPDPVQTRPTVIDPVATPAIDERGAQRTAPVMASAPTTVAERTAVKADATAAPSTTDIVTGTVSTEVPALALMASVPVSQSNETPIAPAPVKAATATPAAPGPTEKAPRQIVIREAATAHHSGFTVPADAEGLAAPASSWTAESVSKPSRSVEKQEPVQIRESATSSLSATSQTGTTPTEQIGVSATVTPTSHVSGQTETPAPSAAAQSNNTAASTATQVPMASQTPAARAMPATQASTATEAIPVTPIRQDKFDQVKAQYATSVGTAARVEQQISVTPDKLGIRDAKTRVPTLEPATTDTAIPARVQTIAVQASPRAPAVVAVPSQVTHFSPAESRVKAALEADSTAPASRTADGGSSTNAIASTTPAVAAATAPVPAAAASAGVSHSARGSRESGDSKPRGDAVKGAPAASTPDLAAKAQDGVAAGQSTGPDATPTPAPVDGNAPVPATSTLASLTATERTAAALGTNVAGDAAHKATSPHAIAHQMAHALSDVGNRTVELTLSPEELGKVRMTLHSTDTSITVAVQADRPETLDLMRRNIESLARDFRDMGYANVDFDFGQQADQRPSAQDRAEGEHSYPQSVSDRDSTPRFDSASTAIQSTSRTTSGGLDLRM